MKSKILKNIKNCLAALILLSGFSSATYAQVLSLDEIKPTQIDITQPTLFVVPYTHLDDIWRWSYPQTIRDFLKKTLEQNFDAFVKYPNYVFNWSGASRYQMMKEYYPEQYQELKKWVDAGRWYPSGSSWVENDVNVPSTEAIIRQLLMGTQYFEKEFGKESREFMLPDCFGFPYSLPSVLNHCGIRGFSTQKLTWESANGIPFNVGRWIGPDGNSVIAALNAGDYSGAHESIYSTDEATQKRLEENRKLSGLPIDYYYMGGGDQNNADRGGVIREISLETLKKINQTKGPVKVVVGKADLMFNAITDSQAEKFPTWNSDLLLIKHSTGVLSSQAYTKKINRDAEILADLSERAAVAAHLLKGVDYPFGTLNNAWGLMLRNQFHDNLPGTSIPKAYEHSWNDGIIALNQFSGIYKDAIGTLAQTMNTDLPGVSVVVFNPLSISRKDNVEAFIPAELTVVEFISVFDAKGKEVPSQLVVGNDGKRRVLFQAELPSVGAAVYSFRNQKSNLVNTELTVKENYLENKNFKVSIDVNGDISSIIDKRLNKELLEKPIQLEFGENFPKTKPAWRIYWEDIKKPARSVASNPVSVKIVENGLLRIAIEVVRMNEGSKITQQIRLSAGAEGSRVEVTNLIDWKSRGALLKAAFHFTAQAPEATYNLDLGTIKRGNRTEKQYEVPHHAWFDLTDETESYGITVLTGAKYGSDKVDNNTLRLTLIHGPDTKESLQESLDDGTMSEMRWQDWGRHEYTFALTSHKGKWQEGNPHWEALRFEYPLAAFSVPKYKGETSAFSLMNIDNNQVNIQAIKMAEDGSGIIVRLQELHGKACSDLTLTAIKPILSAEELDGVERPLNIKLAPKKGTLKLSFEPYELKTILIKLKTTENLASVTKALVLDYDTDVFSLNDNREDGYLDRNPRSEGHRGSFDGKGRTLAGEMIGDEVRLGNISFSIGSREAGKYNALACLGQNIELPKGTKVVHILAAADEEKTVIFKAGKTEFPLNIGAWTGYLGLWDNREFNGYVAELTYSMRNSLKTIHSAFINEQRVAWSASHHHLPESDALYEYSYLYAYRIEIPEGETSVTLPNSRFVRIVAMSVGDEGFANALQSPFDDLYRDESFKKSFNKPEEVIDNKTSLKQ